MPRALGLLTITWIARTRIPLLVVPEHGGAPPPSQVCSLKVADPIPGNRIVVLGGGLSLTDMPPTESPSRLVPCASDEDIPRPDELFGGGMLTKPTTTGSCDGLVCSLAIVAFPLTVPTSEGHPAGCGKSACA